MLAQEASPDMVQEWQRIWKAHRGNLVPNRKTGAEIAAYLKQRYPISELSDEAALHVVTENIMHNEPLREKLPPGVLPSPVAFIVNCGDAGVFVGIDLITGYFHVEGSEALWDELFAFRGLDDADIKNAYLVAEYIHCLDHAPPGRL